MQTFDLGHLEILELLLAEKSVSRVAKKLNRTPSAVSRTLAKMRIILKDQILVLSGRELILTKRGHDLLDQVKKIADQARSILAPEKDIAPAKMRRVFRIRANDHLTAIMGSDLLKNFAREAPNSTVVFHAEGEETSDDLKNGKVDLDIGVAGELGAEFISQHLYADQFVCAFTNNTKRKIKKMSLDEFCAWPHIIVSRTGKTSVLIDAELQKSGRKRTVLVTVATFLEALAIAANNRCIVVAPRQFILRFRDQFNLAMAELPLATPTLAIQLNWHPRYLNDPEHRWLREMIKVNANSVKNAGVK